MAAGRRSSTRTQTSRSRLPPPHHLEVAAVEATSSAAPGPWPVRLAAPNPAIHRLPGLQSPKAAAVFHVAAASRRPASSSAHGPRQSRAAHTWLPRRVLDAFHRLCAFDNRSDTEAGLLDVLAVPSSRSTSMSSARSRSSRRRDAPGARSRLRRRLRSPQAAKRPYPRVPVMSRSRSNIGDAIRQPSRRGPAAPRARPRARPSVGVDDVERDERGHGDRAGGSRAG